MELKFNKILRLKDFFKLYKSEFSANTNVGKIDAHSFGSNNDYVQVQKLSRGGADANNPRPYPAGPPPVSVPAVEKRLHAPGKDLQSHYAKTVHGQLVGDRRAYEANEMAGVPLVPRVLRAKLFFPADFR